MKALRNILHLALIMAILSTGLPFYQAGDINLDERVDLADAVLSVQGVARSANDPALFEKNIENALISLSTAAGFQKAIKADRERAYSQPFRGAPAVLISSGAPLVFTEGQTGSGEDPFLYKSVSLAP